ncbi:hypothetical protein Mmc1_0513 [Magnetococcus marinus MC-1]|uniref:Uncharacterized protein n=1 Tax=Magnetococcus marinus (strain ATCC BAA-1437 / JCM 17883 / MC-1) TaxID=156889 RepID=A0L4Z5_MAGMM|nr:hypothetical protein [Magnetococcus marinus]ABK43038.1 hypothetical protein Mmc1_0513 [Magnetococcus marinus MC-1]
MEMEEGIIELDQVKPGTKITIEFGNLEPALTKLDEPKKFLMEDWGEDEKEIYILEDRIEEDEPLHYALEPMTLEEGLKRNEGKFGLDRVMWDFLGREVGGFEVEEPEEDEDEEEAAE